MSDYSPWPAWYPRAMCSGTSNPAQWDTDAVPRSMRRGDRLIRAAEACAGCPVIVQCAQWALTSRATGVIMAGVPLPDWRWWHVGSGQYVAVLERVAAGGSHFQAVALELCHGKEYAAALRHLLSRAGETYTPAGPTVLPGGVA